MPSPAQSYAALLDELREISLLSSTASILGWDEQTQLPRKAAGFRGDQLALLARLAHERLVAPKLGELLVSLESSPFLGAGDSDASVNVRQTRRVVDRARKLPSSLVEELARVAVLAQQAWVEARKASDFGAFAPWLERIFRLKRQQAEFLGPCQHPYDALLDEFEPGDTTADLTLVFESLRGPLVDLVRRIADAPLKGQGALLERSFPRAAQEALARRAAAAIGFDFERGRLDVSAHPFCTHLGPSDTRLTTRYDEHHFGDAFFGVLHEAGHGLYQQGLPTEHFGTPVGDYVSMGIHESQSRLWENLVGRRRSFWRHFFPRLQAAFPSTADIAEGDWYRAVNHVGPGFIRIEADEATYNLHVLLRFELEKALIAGDLPVADLPGAWNEKMRSYLGLTPPDAARGVLQDIHWAAGLVGYFPTYTLGNLYAAQFFARAQADLGDLDASFARGEFAPLLGWLREKIHAEGQRFTARKLVERVTGKPLSAAPLLAHLAQKAAEVYGV
jgi:carboxypeptidase Taq